MSNLELKMHIFSYFVDLYNVSYEIINHHIMYVDYRVK